MPSIGTLFWAVIFGSIGIAMFLYGKKQQVLCPLFCGIGLIALPYVIDGLLLMIFTGFVLVFIPVFFRD